MLEDLDEVSATAAPAAKLEAINNVLIRKANGIVTMSVLLATLTDRNARDDGGCRRVRAASLRHGSDGRSGSRVHDCRIGELGGKKCMRTLSGFKFDSPLVLKFRHDDKRIYLRITRFDHAHKNTQNFHFHRGTLKPLHASYGLLRAVPPDKKAAALRINYWNIVSGMAF